jgi:hypothetical protein
MTVLVLFPILFAFGPMPSRAQLMTPFTMNDGLTGAERVAHDSIGADAYLEGVMAIGAADPSFPAIDLGRQSAGYWGYVYVSPSRKMTVSVNVVKVAGSFIYDIENGSSTGEDTLQRLDLTTAYSSPAALPARLAADPVFRHFHEVDPTTTPLLIHLTPPQLPAGFEQALPESFPRDQQVWQVVYQSLKEETLTCVVASKTGESFCMQESTAGVEDEGNGMSAKKLGALPNPTTGLVRVELPSGNDAPLSHATAILYDTHGEAVRDLSDELARNGGGFAMVDTRDLPAGLYICRAMAGSWSGSIAIMVEH